jgi:hypothetical protein
MATAATEVVVQSKVMWDETSRFYMPTLSDIERGIGDDVLAALAEEEVGVANFRSFTAKWDKRAKAFAITSINDRVSYPRYGELDSLVSSIIGFGGDVRYAVRYLFERYADLSTLSVTLVDDGVIVNIT